MPTYFGLWKLNTSLQPPADPEAQIAQSRAFMELIKGQMKAGVVKEAHGFLEGNAGYFLTGDLPDDQQLENFLMWSPYVTFELHRTVPFPKFSELALSAIQKRSGKR